ncbi:MAG: anthranilate synthase component I family protein [Deltaproteobacteria bacterium]|nr:anthranilate synthase component I family protein [Deltaproteobacteria bacterium]
MTTSLSSALQAQRLALEPDPLAIARRLTAAGLPHVALLHAAEPTGVGPCSFVAAAPDRASCAVDPLDDDEGQRLPAGEPLCGVPRWIGVIPYECRRGLERASWCAPDHRPAPLIRQPQWWRYPAVVQIDHERGTVAVVGEDPARRARLSDALASEPPAPAPVALVLGRQPPDGDHLARVARARELILAGDLYQVSLARRLDVTLATGSPLELYGRMLAVAPSAYGAMLSLADDTYVVSTSPELLLRAVVEPGSARSQPPFGALATEPIKGTRPRGTDAAQDRQLACELDADPKERAELAMIIDVERNDLGSVCEVGSVQVASPPRVVTHRTIHHRKARVVGRSRGDASRGEVLAAMVPSGSVTGAPKVRAMEVIRQLEEHRRGLYTGGLGFVAHDGSVTLTMAIRTLVLHGEQGHYWTGGGIVADSDPEMELQETGWKALQLLSCADR